MGKSFSAEAAANAMTARTAGSSSVEKSLTISARPESGPDLLLPGWEGFQTSLKDAHHPSNRFSRRHRRDLIDAGTTGPVVPGPGLLIKLTRIRVKVTAYFETVRFRPDQARRSDGPQCVL